MVDNPLVLEKERLEKEENEKAAFRHEFSVHFIVKTTDDIEKTSAFKLVRQFCLENKIPFSSREYDSYKYKEDCDNILKLPAYHIYARRGDDYLETFYPDQNPIQKIQDEILRCQERERKKLQKKEKWEKRVNHLIAFFENLTFKKKPALQMPLPVKKKVQNAKVPMEFSER